jgi:hypothetical protein
VFIIGDRIDFQKVQKQANHINASVRINLTCLVEDKDAERLMIKSYRYQAALSEVLDQVQFMSTDGLAKTTVIVQSAMFSPLYSNAANVADPQAVFRREIGLELDCQLFEQL